jgi:hypothetical protein
MNHASVRPQSTTIMTALQGGACGIKSARQCFPSKIRRRKILEQDVGTASPGSSYGRSDRKTQEEFTYVEDFTLPVV